MARKRSRKQVRAIKAKARHSDAFRNTRAPIGDDSGPLGHGDRLTEDRRLTSDTAIGTGTALTHKPKHLIGGKHRITETKGSGDSLL